VNSVLEDYFVSVFRVELSNVSMDQNIKANGKEQSFISMEESEEIQ
jgi:hypothetical protein